jgi:hypothetical protein
VSAAHTDVTKGAITVEVTYGPTSANEQPR